MNVEITYCDTCKKCSETKLTEKHAGWIQLEKCILWSTDGKKGFRNTIGDGQMHFCSRKCFDKWLSKFTTNKY